MKSELLLRQAYDIIFELDINVIINAELPPLDSFSIYTAINENEIYGQRYIENTTKYKPRYFGNKVINPVEALPTSILSQMYDAPVSYRYIFMYPLRLVTRTVGKYDVVCTTNNGDTLSTTSSLFECWYMAVLDTEYNMTPGLTSITFNIYDVP